MELAAPAPRTAHARRAARWVRPGRPGAAQAGSAQARRSPSCPPRARGAEGGRVAMLVGAARPRARPALPRGATGRGGRALPGAPPGRGPGRHLPPASRRRPAGPRAPEAAPSPPAARGRRGGGAVPAAPRTEPFPPHRPRAPRAQRRLPLRVPGGYAERVTHSTAQHSTWVMIALAGLRLCSSASAAPN